MPDEGKRICTQHNACYERAVIGQEVACPSPC